MVKIYTTSTCPYCEIVKKYLKGKNVAYEEYNIEQDEKALEEMVSKSHQMAVPVIDINNTIIVGFNRSEIDKLLNL